MMALSPLARVGVGVGVLAGVGGTAAFGIGMLSAAGSDPKTKPASGEIIKTGIQYGAAIGGMLGMLGSMRGASMGTMLLGAGLGAAAGGVLGAAGGAGYLVAA